MLSEGSSVEGSSGDKQPSGPYMRGSAKISRQVTLEPEITCVTRCIMVNVG